MSESTPSWLQRLNAHGDAVGGARHLVSLEKDELISTAIASTGGLDDFGDQPDGSADDWRSWFELLVDSLESESRLTLAGRLVARKDLLCSLRNRLLLHDLWKRRPEILAREPLPPSFVVGMARSGTSILSELLSLDGAARSPALWEMLHPTEALEDDRLRPIGDAETVFMEDLAPAYATMHDNSGDLPNECIFIFQHTFISDQWGGTHFIPSYDKRMRATDQRPVYRFHKKMLQTLQQVRAEGCTRWGLKAPSHLGLQEELFDVYPDARVIRIHRDPLKSIPSALNLMKTLKGMYCEGIDLSKAAPMFALGNASVLQQELEKRADGRIPADRVIDVRYQDLMGDLEATVRSIYDQADWELRPDVLQRMKDYVANRPRGARGKHAYSLEGEGLVPEEEVERFRFYREAFDIPNES